MSLISTITSTFWRGALLAKKFAPEIMVATGVVGTVATGVMAAKGANKAREVMETAEEELKQVEKAQMVAKPGEYTPEDIKVDRRAISIRTALGVAKAYAPAAIAGLVTVACLVGNHRILKARNVALVGAYKALESKFTEYRKKVAATLGEEKTKELTETREKDEKGDLVTPPNASQYAQWFDEDNNSWNPKQEYNLYFLRMKQNHLNDKLNIRGHLFLNEVYDELGLERTSAGQLVGWVTNGNGDGMIDLGIYAPVNSAVVNGKPGAWLIDPNVDGVVYDLI